MDTQGNLLSAKLHSAEIQDRDGVPGVLEDTLDNFLTVARFFADGGYSGDKLKDAISQTY